MCCWQTIQIIINAPWYYKKTQEFSIKTGHGTLGVVGQYTMPNFTPLFCVVFIYFICVFVKATAS